MFIHECESSLFSLRGNEQESSLHDVKSAEYSEM